MADPDTTQAEIAAAVHGTEALDGYRANTAPECGHPWCGGDGGLCPDCGFDPTAVTR